jgi:serine protease
VERLSAGYVRKLALGGDLVRLSRPLNDVQAHGLMRAISADPAVLHVERDARLSALRDSPGATAASPRMHTSGDQPFPSIRWNYDDPRGGANIAKAWELADGNDVVVAVLDTGIAWHPDLDLSLADAGYDFIRDAFTSGRPLDGRVPGGWDPGDWSNTPEYEECFDEPAGKPAAGTARESPASWPGWPAVRWAAWA